jgi:hypothetical protein
MCTHAALSEPWTLSGAIVKGYVVHDDLHLDTDKDLGLRYRHCFAKLAHEKLSSL